MKLKIKEIDLTGITQSEAKDIRDELNKLSKGMIQYGEYPALGRLDKYLSSAFDSSISGLHTIKLEAQNDRD